MFFNLFGKRKSASEILTERTAKAAEQRTRRMEQLETRIKQLHSQMEKATGRAKERLAQEIRKCAEQQTKLQAAK